MGSGSDQNHFQWHPIQGLPMLSTPTADVQCMQQCLKGPSDAFEPLVRRYQNAAYAVALNYMRDPLDAQDVVQDAFVAAYCKLAQLRDPAVFGGWLRQIVVTRCTEWLRRKKLQHQSPRPMQHADDNQADTGHEQQVARQEIWCAKLSRFTRRQARRNRPVEVVFRYTRAKDWIMSAHYQDAGKPSLLWSPARA